MVKYYHYTSVEDLDQIKKLQAITPSSKTLFSAVLGGVYLVKQNPQQYRNSTIDHQADCHVELDLPSSHPCLAPCAPMNGLDVFLYRGTLHLEDLAWSSGLNQDWRPSRLSSNWKVALGVGAAVGVGVGAVVLGKVAYGAYKRRTARRTEEESNNLESFINVGKKAANKILSMDYVGEGHDDTPSMGALDFKDSDSDEWTDDIQAFRRKCNDDFVRVPEYPSPTGN